MQVFKSVVFKIYKVLQIFFCFCHMHWRWKGLFYKNVALISIKMAVNVIFTSDFVSLLVKGTTLVL